MKSKICWQEEIGESFKQNQKTSGRFACSVLRTAFRQPGPLEHVIQQASKAIGKCCSLYE